MIELDPYVRRLLAAEAAQRLTADAAPSPRPLRHRLGHVLVSAGARLAGEERHSPRPLRRVSSGRPA
jgi:hypothetical protein